MSDEIKLASGSTPPPKISEKLATLGQVRTALDKDRKEIDKLKNRVNNIASLPEGSTTADAELADIRVGENGTTYNSAGEAVRTQFREKENEISELKEDLSNIVCVGANLINKDSVTQGIYINRKVLTDGVTLSTETLTRNTSWWTYEKYIPVSKGDIFSVSNNDLVFIAGYQADKTLCCVNYEDYNEFLAYVFALNKSDKFTITNSKCKYIRVSSSIPIENFVLNKGEILDTDSTFGVKIRKEVIIPQLSDIKENIEELRHDTPQLIYDYTQRGLYQFSKEMLWSGNYSVDADVIVAKITVSALTGIYYQQRWTDGNNTGTCAFVDFANNRFGFKKTETNNKYPTNDYVANDIPFTLKNNHEYYIEHSQIRGHLFLKITDALTFETASIDASKQMYGCCWGSRLDYSSDNNISVNYHKVYSLQPYNAHVLILGDSFIEGYAPNSYASLMKRYFNGSVFINGYSGGGSSHLVRMMSYLPNLVQPKYVIIAIGTNENDYDTWLSNIQTVLNKIETEMNGAIPIFATITLHTSYWNNDEFIQKANAWIRSSKYKYVDLNKITTVDYDMVTQNLEMFREDKVHPTDETFEKMFERYKIDVPELFISE